MLRALVALLLVANLAWWAWFWPPTASWLGRVEREREPQRLQQQIEADSIRLLNPARAQPETPSPGRLSAASASPAAEEERAAPAAGAASAPEAAASTAAVSSCLEAGPLNEQGLAQAKRELLLAGASSERWVDMRRELPGSVAIYMGRFADAEQVRKKDDELRALGVPREPATGALAPGLILGRYTSQEQAQIGLQRLQSRGVRTARLMTLVPPAVEHVVRVERAEPELQAKLTRPAPASGAAGIGWRACKG